MAVQINFLIDQGSTFDAVVTVQNEDGTVFDLTNWTPYSQMRKHERSVGAINITVAVLGDPVNGEIQMELFPADTNPLRGGRFIYDVELHHNTDLTRVKRAVQGIITLSPQSTKIP